MNWSLLVSLLFAAILRFVKPVHFRLAWVAIWKTALSTTGWLNKHYLRCLLTLIAVEVTLILIRVTLR